MADDLDAGGVTAKAVAGHEGDRPGTVLPLRMLAALHRLVLEGRAPALSSFYPSVGGAALAGAAWPAAAAAMREHLADMHLLVDQTVQTNEPGRASLLFGGLLVVAERTGLPIRLLEIGSSAGSPCWWTATGTRSVSGCSATRTARCASTSRGPAPRRPAWTSRYDWSSGAGATRGRSTRPPPTGSSR